MQMAFDDHPRYTIGIAARMIGTTTSMLRALERASLVAPRDVGGLVKLYSERDLAKARIIISLMDEGIPLESISSAWDTRFSGSSLS